MKLNYRPLDVAVVQQATATNRPGRVALDLSEYNEALMAAYNETGGIEVDLDEGDTTKAIKGRFTRALKQIKNSADTSHPLLSKALRFRGGASDNSIQIILVDVDPNAPKRGRKPRATVNVDGETPSRKAKRGELTAV